MLTTKQKLKNIVEENKNNTWENLRQNYNSKVGFIDSSLEEKELAKKFNYDLRCSSINFSNSSSTNLEIGLVLILDFCCV